MANYCIACGNRIIDPVAARDWWAPYNEQSHYCVACPPPERVTAMLAEIDERKLEQQRQSGGPQSAAGPARFLYRARTDGCYRKPRGSEINVS